MRTLMIKGKKKRSNASNLARGKDTLVDEYTAKHLQLFYESDVWLPVLLIEARVKEICREEFSETERMILDLIHQGVESIVSLETLTGLPSRFLAQLLKEFSGKFYINLDNASHRIKITDLGIESISAAKPIRLVRRAYRYCGTTSRLLPKAAYSCPLIDAANKEDKEEYLKFAQNDFILPEDELVSLKELDFELIADKKRFNITDETVRIETISGYQPRFLKARVYLFGSRNPEIAIISFGNDHLEYTIQDALRYVAPLDKKVKSGKTQLQIFQECLIKEGVELIQPLYLDEYKLPVAKIKTASENWLKKGQGIGVKSIEVCGTAKHKSKPVSHNLLKGHTISYRMEDDLLSSQIDLLRTFFDQLDRFYKTRRETQQDMKKADFLLERFSTSELQQITQLLNRYQLKKHERDNLETMLLEQVV